MTAGVAVLVVIAILAMAGLGIAAGLDLLGLLLLVLTVGVGALGVVVARRGQAGRVTPSQCASCGGLLSPHATVCKHCGTPVPSPSKRVL